MFLTYHEILRNNPSSVVFAPLAEILILHGCFEEAILTCKKGLERDPSLVSGRIALAKAYLGVSNLKRAREEAEKVLRISPDHPKALEIAAAQVPNPLPMPPIPNPTEDIEEAREASMASPQKKNEEREVVTEIEEEEDEEEKTEKMDIEDVEDVEDVEELDFTPSSLDPTEDVRWSTVTMAEIFAAQGDILMARKVYKNILMKEPGNILALKGLEKLADSTTKERAGGSPQ